MKRSTVIISAGILFILAAIAMIIIGIALKEEIVAMLSAAGVFLFTGIILLFSGIDALKFGRKEKAQIEKEFGRLAIQAEFNKRYMAAVFLILFGTLVLAITASILSLSGFEEAGFVVLGICALYGLVLNLYFIVKLNNKEQRKKIERQMDDLGYKIAFFFATLTTGGLFALGYLIYKKIKS
jgi:hypothetical protein